MTRLVPRRSLLAAAALLPPALWLAACSDSGKEANAQETVPSTETTASTASAVPPSEGDVDMAKLLKPGALPDMALGKPDAKVTIVEYASMTCPHCARFARNVLPVIKEKYIDAGKVRLIFREFPFDPRAEAGFMLARCSKDKYFPMVDVLFEQQNVWAAGDNPRDSLLQISRLAGFSQASFEACLTDQKLLDQIKSVRDRATKEFGVNSTPTFFINGKTYKGEMTVEQMSAILDGMLGA